MKPTVILPGPFVDRIEGDVAVLIVDGREQIVAVASLPAGAREGSVLTPDLRAVDATATQDARARIAALRSEAARDDDGGDFSL